MSKLLKTAEIVLQKHNLYVESPDKKALVVSEDLDSLPFAYVIHDKKEFDGLILCLSVDSTNVHLISSLLLELFMLTPVVIGEKFYISPDGETYWSEEAEVAFALDNLDISKMESPGKLWN